MSLRLFISERDLTSGWSDPTLGDNPLWKASTPGSGVPVMGLGLSLDLCNWSLLQMWDQLLLTLCPLHNAWTWLAALLRREHLSSSRFCRAPSERNTCFLPKAQFLAILDSWWSLVNRGVRYVRTVSQSSVGLLSLSNTPVPTRTLYLVIKFLNLILWGNPPAMRLTVSKTWRDLTCCLTKVLLNSELDSLSFGRMHRMKWGLAWTRVLKRLSRRVWKSCVNVETGSWSEWEVGDILKVAPLGTVSSE